jgi:Ca-activated chloride channel homolog
VSGNRPGVLTAASAGLFLMLAWSGSPMAGERQSQRPEGFRFRSGVELINVTATVTDSNGRFVPGLRQEHFRVLENGIPQTITHFSSERVPVSLGILVDTSGSMEGEKFLAARQALERFFQDLLAPEDEIFLYSFDSRPELVQHWTTDRRLLSRAVSRMRPRGGTALYDAVAEAVPLVQTGQHRKKALLMLSDGVDTSSRSELTEVRQLIRETEVLVYAIGIDAPGARATTRAGPRRPQPRFPIPFPGPRRPGQWPVPVPRPPLPGGGSGGSSSGRDHFDAAALRDLTDDSGGRTEVIRAPRDLNPATGSVADELSRQYYLGYPSPGHRDGRWYTIDVEVDNPAYRVRARRGYLATP